MYFSIWNSIGIKIAQLHTEIEQSGDINERGKRDSICPLNGYINFFFIHFHFILIHEH